MDTAAVRGVAWLASDQIGSRALDLVFTIVLARLLFPGDFGLLAMAATSTSFFRLFANLGLGAAIVQRRDVDEGYLSTAYWANLASGVVLFLIVAASGELLGLFLREPRVGTVVLFLSFRFVVAAGSATQMAMITRRMDFRALALRAIAATTIGGLVGVALAFAGLGVWSLVGRELARAVANTILLYRATGWRPKLLFSWAKFLDLWSFGGPLLLSRLFRYLAGHVDLLLIGRYLGSAAVGYYAFGSSVFTAPLNDILPHVQRVMFASLSRLHGDDDRFKRGFLLATRYVTMITMPLMVGLSLVASLLVTVMFGARWLPSALVVSILALTGFLGQLTALGHSGLQAGGRTDLQLRLTFLSMLVHLPAYAIGLRWGIVGVAAGALAAAAVLVPVQYRVVTQATGVKLGELWEAVYPNIIGSAVMAAVVAPAKQALTIAGYPSMLVLALLVALGVAVYGAVVWIIQRQAVLGLVRIVRDALPVQNRRLAGEAE